MFQSRVFFTVNTSLCVRMCPVHFHFIFFICLYIGLWLTVSQDWVLGITLGHHTPVCSSSICSKRSGVCYMILLSLSHKYDSHLYSSTDLTSMFNICSVVFHKIILISKQVCLVEMAICLVDVALNIWYGSIFWYDTAAKITEHIHAPRLS